MPDSSTTTSLPPSVTIDISRLQVPSNNNLPPRRRHSDVPPTALNSSPSDHHRRRSSLIASLNNFYLSSKPHQSLQSYLRHQQWNHSLLETYINRCFYLGLSPFRILFHPTTAYPSFSSSILPQALFLLVNLICVFHDFCQLRLLTLSYDQFKHHPKMVYVFLGYRAVLTFMQFRYFQLLWWKRYKFTNLLASFRQADLITVRPTWTSLFPTLILFSSLFSSSICIFFGFNQLTELESWSPWTVLERYRNELLICTVGPNLAVNITTLYSTALVGGLGASIDLISEILHFCSVDVFFLSTVTIWMLAKELEVEQVSISMAKTLHRQQKQVMLISREINEIVKLFLPPLTTATVISITYLIHLLLQQRWFMAFYVALKVTKPCIAYVFALKIKDRIEDFEFWFFSDEVQDELGMSVKELQIKILELSGLPIGIGQGPFHVNVRFITSFIGIISTYFFLIREGFGFGTEG